MYVYGTYFNDKKQNNFIIKNVRSRAFSPPWFAGPATARTSGAIHFFIYCDCQTVDKLYSMLFIILLVMYFLLFFFNRNSSPKKRLKFLTWKECFGYVRVRKSGRNISSHFEHPAFITLQKESKK